MARIPSLLILALTAITLPAAATEVDDDRTGSPHFVVDGDVEKLPLRSTNAEIDIAGVIARVKVTQTYENSGSKPIEAVYVFPGSTRSAVFRMKMTIGERTIEAKIQEKEAARKLYEKAKAQGKSASLLEQHRPNVFQMNVANIMPGDVIRVEMTYAELLVPTDGVYELVYPTVVGPRYAGAQGAQETKQEGWTANPYLAEGAKPTYTFGLTAKLSAGMPIASLASPSHTVSPRFLDRDTAEVVLDDPRGGDRDFILKYRLAKDAVQTGVLLFPGQDENFFLMMMQPPARPNPTLIPPREFIFVLDVSGSMHGFPLDTAKALIEELLAGMRAEDRFNIMFFSGGSTVLSDKSVPASRTWKRRAVALLTQQRGGGGTQILPAMERALAMPRADNMSTSIVVVTDGYVSVEKRTFDVIAENLGEANLFAFGIGRSVNRHLIEGMARTGMGEPFVVLDAASAKKAAAKFKTYIESPVLTNVKMSVDGFDAYDVEPKHIPDVFAQRPVVVFGKYRGAANGHISLSGYDGRGRWSNAIAVNASKASPDHEALRLLWARHRIQRLDDLQTLARSNAKEEVTKLGLRYSLMTQYTSFVAIDSEVRNHQGAPARVDQPLPLPSGVSGLATGRGYAPSAAAPLMRVRRERRAVPKSSPARTPSEAPAILSAPEAESAADRDGRDDLDEATTRSTVSKDKASSNQASRRIVRRELEKCYEDGAKASAGTKVVVLLTPTGRVSKVLFVGAPIPEARARCIRLRLKKRTFTATGRSERLEIPLAS